MDDPSDPLKPKYQRVVLKLSGEGFGPQGGKNGISYKYFMVETNYDEDRWVQAVEAKAGAREVVHHILVYAIPKELLGKKAKNPDAVPADGLGNGLLVAYAPGDLPNKLPAGHAKKLPKGSTLWFQIHYTPNGSATSDRTELGLVFAKAPPRLVLVTPIAHEKMGGEFPDPAPHNAVLRRYAEAVRVFG